MMTDDRSTGTLLNDVLARLSGLVRGEVDLARAEINENLTRAGVAVGMIVGGVVVALTALNVLSAALVAALTELGIDGAWSALIVGVVFGIIAFVMLQKGRSDLSLNSIAPSRTGENLRRDAQTLKGSQHD